MVVGTSSDDHKINVLLEIVTQPKLRNNRRDFSGRHPLKRIDDEISMFPAGCGELVINNTL